MESPTSQNTHAKKTGRRVVLLLVGGFVLGVAVTGLAVWQMMPGMMITQHESPYGIDETVARLQESIETQGWKVSGVRNLNKSVEKEGRSLDKQVRIVELCHPDYAGSVLTTNPEVSTLMPCALGVWEENGKVYISGMNMGLMGTMFGGNIADVMGGAVAKDEHEILSRALAQ